MRKILAASTLIFAGLTVTAAIAAPFAQVKSSLGHVFAGDNGMPPHFRIKDVKVGDVTGDGVKGVWDSARLQPFRKKKVPVRGPPGNNMKPIETNIPELLLQLRRSSGSLSDNAPDGEDLLQDSLDSACSNQGAGAAAT